MIISQNLLNGVYITVYEAADPVEQYTFNDPSPISEEACEDRVAHARFEQENSTTIKLSFDFTPYADIIIALVRHIKANPSINLTQFNTYVNSLHWADSAVVRFFVLNAYTYLREHYPGISDTSTELGVLGVVRDKIVELSYRKLSMIIFHKPYSFNA